jgi:hypothetical protein
MGKFAELLLSVLMRRAARFITVSGLLVASTACQSDRIPTVQLRFPSRDQLPFSLDTVKSFVIESGEFSALTGVGKIEKLPDGDFAILGGPVSTLYRANSAGKLQRVIATTGEGPIGFPLITDFCVTRSGEILIITDNPVQVGVFNAEGHYLRRYTLPWIAGESIQECQGGFVIAVMVMYDPSKGKGRSTPLSYSDRRFLVRYDSSFSNPVPMLGPSPELVHTDGLFILPHRKFTPFVVSPSGESLWAMTQEGFYRIEEFDIRGRHIRRFNVESRRFVPVNPHSMVDFRKVGYDQALHGRLIASHSAPNLFLIGRTLAIVRMNMPYENYYPQYCREPMPRYYYDVFVIRSGRLTPLYEGFQTDLWLIGVERNTDTFYFTRLEFQPHEISPPRIYAVTIIPNVAM